MSLQVDDDVMVVADRARFKRVVGNLLSNAVEHGDGGVEVRGYQEGEQVVIEVCNRGSGIDEIDLSRVFDRFYKSDRSRSAPGSGLGLSIALANARLQGGSLSARKLEGGVACFTFTLRAATGGDGATASSEARTVPLTSGG